MNQVTAITINTIAQRELPKLPPIPRARYLDAAFYQAELTHVFRKAWLFAGHVSEFEKPGSYRLLELELAPVVIIRGKDGVLRAFLNSCQHRGATVLRDRTGCAQVMTCQYHGWTYNLEGALVGITDPETFPDLDLKDYRLAGLRCECWGGLVFINFDAQAPALLDWLTPSFTRHYSKIVEAPLRIIARKTWAFDCNWKLSVEAFRESYHFETIHLRTAAQMADYRKTDIELNRNGHGTLSLPYRRPAELQSTEWAGMPIISNLPRLVGAEGPEFSEQVKSPDLFPNTSMAFQQVGFPVVTTWPVAVDRCRVEAVWFGKDWGEGARPAEWEIVTAGHYAVMDEDQKNLMSMQKSLESDPGKAIPLSTQEACIYQLHAEIDLMIGPEHVAPGLRVPDVLRGVYV